MDYETILGLIFSISILESPAFTNRLAESMQESYVLVFRTRVQNLLVLHHYKLEFIYLYTI